MRLVIVDDDAASRDGLRNFLGSAPNIDLVAVCDHEEAIARNDWSSIDTVLLDVGNYSAVYDQLPGAMVAYRIRRLHPGPPPTIVAFTAYWMRDNVHYRMGEAGADYLVERSWLCQSADHIRSVVQEPGAALEPPRVVPAYPGLEGVNPNEVVGVLKEVIDDLGINPAWLEANVDQRPATGSPTRHQKRRLGARVGRMTGLRPRTVDGAPHKPEVEDPTFPQLRHLISKLTKLR